MEFQKFLSGGFVIEHTKFNLSVSDFGAIYTVLLLPTD
jgi:hypothetical protein